MASGPSPTAQTASPLATFPSCPRFLRVWRAPRGRTPFPWVSVTWCGTRSWGGPAQGSQGSHRVAESPSERDRKAASPRLRCCAGLVWGHPEEESGEQSSQNAPALQRRVWGPAEHPQTVSDAGPMAAPPVILLWDRPQAEPVPAQISQTKTQTIITTLAGSSSGAEKRWQAGVALPEVFTRGTLPGLKNIFTRTQELLKTPEHRDNSSTMGPNRHINEKSHGICILRSNGDENQLRMGSERDGGECPWQTAADRQRAAGERVPRARCRTRGAPGLQEAEVSPCTVGNAWEGPGAAVRAHCREPVPGNPALGSLEKLILRSRLRGT